MTVLLTVKTVKDKCTNLLHNGTLVNCIMQFIIRMAPSPTLEKEVCFSLLGTK